MTRTLGALAALLLMVTGLGALAAPASAAELPGAITSVTTNKTSYGYDENVRLDFTWAVPDGSVAGDTFTLPLPDALRAASLARFTLADADGTPIATAAWSGKTIVFTLTDYAATHRGVAGSGFVTVQWDHSVVTETGGPVVLKVGSSVTTVEIAPKPAPKPTNPGTSTPAPTPTPTQRGLGKSGGWADGAYEGTRDAADNIDWDVRLPGNPIGFTGPVDVVDRIGAGSVIDCATLRVSTRPGLASGTPTAPVDASRYTVTCTGSTLHLVLDRISPDEFIDLRYQGTITDQSAGTYSNAVTVTAPGQTWSRTTAIRRTAAGGIGAGTQSVSVGDYVWLDADGNGRQDQSEHGIAGVTLVLTGPGPGPVTDIDGHPVGATVTGAAGRYLFTRLPVLPAGQHYTVSIDEDASRVALTGLVPTAEHVGDRVGDSSTWAAESGDVTADGASDLTLDFGFRAIAASTTPAHLPGSPPGSPPGSASGGAGGPVAPPAPPAPSPASALGTVVLAHTGSDIGLPVALALALSALGLGLILLGRRRSRRGRVQV